ncbi:YetF domain-containing protein [Paenibacillus sp. NPDC058174]|uniref:YetF domain-containing protein n=1 Tax=Paenibacillus sp. NPDC058174 TaxID=3346366 RepID=UPI0036DC6A8B
MSRRRFSLDFWGLLVRTVIIYFIVFLIMRAMGKREIGKLSVFDLVISVMIAEIAVIVIEDLSRPMWEGIMPMVVLLAIQIGMAIIGLKSRKFRQLTDGKPSIIMAKGKLNRDVMRKQRYNLDDLMLQLRENGMSRLADVEFAILETTGKLSVIPKESEDDQDHDMSHKHQSELGDMDDSHNGTKTSKSAIPPKYRFETLPVPLIMDGKVQDNNLAQLEKTRFWLKNVLQEQGVNDFKDVFLCTIDHKGRVFIDSDRKPRT